MTRHAVTVNGTTFTRTSKTKVYSHVVVARSTDKDSRVTDTTSRHAVSWHTTEDLAYKALFGYLRSGYWADGTVEPTVRS